MLTSERIAFTLPRLAEETGVSVRTWQRRISTGELPAVRIGTRILVTREAILDFLRDHEDASGQPSRPAPEWMRDPARRSAAARKAAETRRASLTAEAQA